MNLNDIKIEIEVVCEEVLNLLVFQDGLYRAKDLILCNQHIILVDENV